MPTYAQAEPIILNALSGVLKNMSLAYSIAWPNVEAPAVPTNGYYAEVFFLLNPNMRLFVKNTGKYRYMGIFQITVSTPVLKGVVDLLEQAGAIAQQYEQTAKISVTGGHVRIMDRPSVVHMKSQNGARWIAPVSVNWRAII